MKWEEIENLIRGEISFRLASPDESRMVYEAAFRTEAKEILELGLWLGTFTIPLLIYCKENNAHLTTIDVNPYPNTQEMLERLGLTKCWTFICQDDMEVVKTWDKQVELIVLDTSHYYDHTIKELQLFSPFVTKEILMHDVLHDAHGKELLRVVMDFLIDGRYYSHPYATRERIPCWNFEIYNTWNGMGRLYRTVGECGIKSG